MKQRGGGYKFRLLSTRDLLNRRIFNRFLGRTAYLGDQDDGRAIVHTVYTVSNIRPTLPRRDNQKKLTTTGNLLARLHFIR